MVFSSTAFLFGFLPCLFVCYFIVPQGKNGKLLPIKNFILLGFSIAFYAWGGFSFLPLLVASIAINYIGGLAVSVKNKTAKKLILAVTVILNLGLLAWFKYANFAAETAQALGLSVTVPNVVLPIGISFFTFQGMSYVIDVYRGDAKVQKNPLNVALYVALFPQLVAGPIVRYTTVENEITCRRHTVTDIGDGITRFMLGFGKKMILANAMGEIADEIFAVDIAKSLTAPLAWVGALTYAFQIYFDFSAYSDMAIGLGRIFGFRFDENFNYPYMASSVTDFWRRWHISLSTWFRDYVYIPLGGNRCSVLRNVFNLAVVWALTGLWHGADWTFVVWGLYFGVLLIIEKYLLKNVLPHIPAFVRHIVTLFIVLISWVLFRSDTITDALSYIGVMFGGCSGSDYSRYAVYYLRQYYPEFILAVIASFPIANVVREFAEKRKDNAVVYSAYVIGSKVFAFAVFILGCFKLVSGSFNPFIYFRF